MDNLKFSFTPEPKILYIIHCKQIVPWETQAFLWDATKKLVLISEKT